jgi:hypothetical protein
MRCGDWRVAQHECVVCGLLVNREAGEADVPKWDNTAHAACQMQAPSLPFTAPLGKMARLYRHGKGDMWARTCILIASPESAAT